MRKYSFNDFRYICYVEGKKKAVEKLFSNLIANKDINLLCKKIVKDDLILHDIYEYYKRYL
ncbi:TPA: hypothetical protein ACT9U4_000464 [Listeria monocytogenes]|uniref:Uncharacterized protein n=1 Tax=Listeria monocytogenes serotype 1/2a (strain EGD / Mackaness) TaxID=1334565 RepID=A0A3Q0NDX0_LISMG|nr:hypothetical protein [Listeria monocytogenes]AHJ02950.1 hypothetical protein AX10_00260 [Listeria monocytogenes WSLC1001]EAE6021204.1 hypothetical protein [Listeria monocytogenes serotype 3a]UZV40884.1 hypothetical protein [Listeria phage LP-P111]EAC5826975.1 hypothetical protein [Listeria monocytogenes]EAD1304257.1 hypothetical protein [Listeria monocytogenes]